MVGARRAQVTMADVARDAGVSVMTVSYSYSAPERVSEKTRERIADSARKLAYPGPNPAGRSLRQGLTNSVAVVVGEGLAYAFDDPESSRFLAGVAEVCVRERQAMTLLPVTGDETDANRIRESPADGFILWTGVATGPLLDAIVATNKPVAIQGAEPDGLPADPAADRQRIQVVTIDDRAAAAAVAATVLRGASRPAVVSFALTPDQTARVTRDLPLDGIPFPGARQRLLGYRDAFGAGGVDWASVPVAVVRRNHRVEARPIVEELFEQHPDVDAVVAMSDQLALTVLDVCAERGRAVPQDVAVAGWDDSAEAGTHELTTVHQSLHAQGVQCAEAVLGGAGAGGPVEWSLVTRGSTRAVR